jgi:hypothetical protein
MITHKRPSLWTLEALYFSLLELSLLPLIEGIGDHTTLQTERSA